MTTEIDNHTDTSVAGANFHPIAFSGEVCDVSPFSDKYEATMNVPIATCATIMNHPDTGEERILIISKMLWFGNQMPILLLQPNQCRA